MTFPFPVLCIDRDPSERLYPVWQCPVEMPKVALALGGMCSCQRDIMAQPSSLGGWLGLATGHADVVLLLFRII